MAFNGNPRPQAPYSQYAQQPMPTMQGGEPYSMGSPIDANAAYSFEKAERVSICLLYTSPSPRDS